MPDRSVVYRLRADITQFKAGLAQASAATKKAADDMTAATKSAAKFRSGLTTVGNASGKVGLVAAVGLGAIVFAAAKFDKAMSSVQAATHGSAHSMDLLRAAAIKAGADTQFSATEAAGGIEELAKAGVSTKDILAGGLSGALNLAAAGAIGVSEAAETAATAMTQFKLGGDQVNHVADLLAAGAGKAQGGVSDLGMALKQSGLVAAQTGLSIEETVGALSEFASAGLLGSDAGTSFKTMLQALTPSSVQARDKMQELGISAYDAQGNFIGMSAFAGQLQGALSKLSVEQQNAALKTIFGADAVRAASIIFKDGAAGVDKWQKKVNDAGYAAETAGTRMDNLAGDFEQFKGSLETALIGGGEGAQGPLRKLTQGATEAVNALNALPGPAKNAATGLLAVTAVLGASVWAGTKVVAGVAAMRTALTALGITAEGTRAKLALIGTGGATAALGIGTFIDTISQMDSLSRSGDAADATVKSFQDLSDALSYSNVGKFADDLHINLGRLSEDLFQNGADGEYAKRIIDQLSDSSHGFNAALGDYTSIIPFYQAGTQKAGEASKDLGAIIENNKGIIGSGAAATTSAAGATGQLSAAMQQNAAAAKASAEALKASRAAASETAHSFVTLGDSLNDSKVSLGDWIRELAQQADALRNFTSNSAKAAGKGLSGGLIAELQKAGPEGALRMKQLANAVEGEIGKANRAWNKGQRAVRDYTNAVGGVPKSKSTTVTQHGSETATKRIREINAEIRALRDKRVSMSQKGAEAAAAKIRALRRERDALKDKSVTITFNKVTRISTIRAPGGKVGTSQADGGTIPGERYPYGDKVLAYLAPGEEVITNRHGQADRFRADRASGRIPAYAEGGTIQRLADGGRVRGNGDDEVARAHKKHASAVNASTKAINREKNARGKLVAKRDELASSVKDAFAPDPFGGEDNVWAAGAGDPRAALRASIAKSKAFSATLGRLKHMGLDGAALAAIATTGDVGKANALAGLGKAGVGQYEALYKQATVAANSVGKYAGNAAYGPQIAEINRHLAALNKKVGQGNKDRNEGHKRTGAAVAKGVNKGAGSAKRGRR